jgi:hypothetical protein
MAIGDPYATLPQLKSYLKITDADDDAELNDALSAASKGITKFCGRQFNNEIAPTARTYQPTRSGLAMVDDFHTTAGLIVKTDDSESGVFGTTWSATDFELEPLNGVRDGEPGWPYWKIKTVPWSGLYFRCSPRATVEVTAQWGWAAVPDPIHQACLILASETFKLKDAPFGIAGYGDFGPVRVRDNPMAKAKLIPYRRNAVLVA